MSILSNKLLFFPDNVLAKKVAKRSSGEVDYPASLATDLDLSQTRSSSSCTIGIAGTDPWWSVDMTRVQPVKRVVIVTLDECCGK